MLTRETLIEFIEDEVGVDTSKVNEDTLLFSTGIVDSFALVTLMSFVETQTGIRMEMADVTLENFDSVNRMIAYIKRVIEEKK